MRGNYGCVLDPRDRLIVDTDHANEAFFCVLEEDRDASVYLGARQARALVNQLQKWLETEEEE